MLLAPRLGHADPLDRGIGGTGSAPEPNPDRGIGGTGVVGTIRGFGSIVVNDRHIAYADDVPVTIEGERIAPTALKLGHVVRVRAVSRDGALTAEHITVLHEVVGRIEHVAGPALVVLGQRVQVSDLEGPWHRGDRIAVSGLRLPDDTILASLVEPAGGLLDRVTGTAHGGPGAMAIGRLDIPRLAARHGGQRVSLTGEGRRGRFRALAVETEAESLAALQAETVSIETYVRQDANGLTTSGGYVLNRVAAPALPVGLLARAVLTTVVARGNVTVQSYRIAEDASRPTGARPQQGFSARTGSDAGPHGPAGRHDGKRGDADVPGGPPGASPGTGGPGSGGPGSGGPVGRGSLGGGAGPGAGGPGPGPGSHPPPAGAPSAPR